jgi:hypothetical protein
MKTTTYPPTEIRAGHIARQRLVRRLRAAAAEAAQTDARRQWVRAATQC